jgi:hypothetical protein
MSQFYKKSIITSNKKAIVNFFLSNKIEPLCKKTEIGIKKKEKLLLTLNTKHYFVCHIKIFALN